MPEVLKTVGRYEILRDVGRGGMAIVYLARQSDLDRFVALKELGAFHASDPSFAQRFLRESRVAGSLSHPNIVTVHDYFEHDGTPYIAMEYIERGSLRPYVGKMTLAQIGGVLEGLLAGLTHAETHDIVHRDLKPENLMVTADGRVKIADFGIAKATTRMQTGAFLTATGTTVGTPTYMAPEQAMAQDIGPWTDLYSVGCMAFELFTGNVPFHDSDAPMAILLRHVNEPIAPVKSIRPEVDQRVSDWIEQLLVKEPTERTQNAQDAWDDFEEILLSLLGPRWRREARLVERVDETDGAKPLTPAPFQGTTAGEPGSEEFKSFAWGAPGGDTGGTPAAPPMYTPPPSSSAPAIPDVVVGPPTPMPSQAVPAPPPPTADPVADSGFVTFGAPAPPPPTDALVAPPTDAAAPPAAASDVAEAAAPATGFETYVEPPPSRPPTSEPALTPAPVDAVPAPPQRAAAAPGPAPEPEPPPAAPVTRPPLETVMPRSLRETPPPDTPAAPPAERSSRRFVVPAAIAGGVVVVGAVAAIALGGGGGSDKTAATATPQKTAAPLAAPVSDSTSGISFAVPGTWSKSGSAPAVPGFDGDQVAMSGPGGAAVVVGKSDRSAANSTLLADDLRAAAGSLPPKGQIADLGGGLQALRYDGLGVGSGKTGTVYAIPTTKGVATVACLADVKTCGSIAASVNITSGKPFGVGPSASFGNRVSRTLTTLSRREGAAASALRHAKTRGSQAGATGRLATSYNLAAKALRGRQLSPADVLVNTQLVAALRATGKAYGAAESRARHKDRAGYRRDGDAAVKAHRDVTQTIAALKKAGYTLPASLVSRFSSATHLPTLKQDPVQRPATTSTPSTTAPSQPTPAPVQPSPAQPTPVQPAPVKPAPKPQGGGGTGGGSVSGGGEG